MEMRAPAHGLRDDGQFEVNGVRIKGKFGLKPCGVGKLLFTAICLPHFVGPYEILACDARPDAPNEGLLLPDDLDRYPSAEKENPLVDDALVRRECHAA